AGMGEVPPDREPREGDQRRGGGTPRALPVAGGLSTPRRGDPAPGRGGTCGRADLLPLRHELARSRSVRDSPQETRTQREAVTRQGVAGGGGGAPRGAGG